MGTLLPPFTEDFNGNLTSDGDRQYKFDALNRVAQVARVSDGALLAEFAYDGLNRRVLKKVGANSTRYLCAYQDVIAEVDGADALQARYITGREIDEPLVMERRDVADVDGDGNTTEFQTFYYHTNHLGSVSALTWWDAGAAQEKLVERYQYNAFGWLVVTHWGADRLFGTSDDSSQPASLVGNPYGFTARALDAETGLMYYRARYYSVLVGKMLFLNKNLQSFRPAASRI